MDDLTFKAQFNFGLGRGALFMVICGESELEQGAVAVKNLNTRKQEEVPLDGLVEYFQAQKA